MSQNAQQQTATPPIHSGMHPAGGQASFASAPLATTPIAHPANAANDSLILTPQVLKDIVNGKAQIPALNPSVEEKLEDAVGNSPHFKKLQANVKNEMDAMAVASHVLQHLFSGNQMAYVPADAVQAVVNEAFAHVAEFQAHQQANPNSNIAELARSIGPGSFFFHKNAAFLESHHEELGENTGTNELTITPHAISKEHATHLLNLHFLTHHLQHHEAQKAENAVDMHAQNTHFFNHGAEDIPPNAANDSSVGSIDRVHLAATGDVPAQQHEQSSDDEYQARHVQAAVEKAHEAHRPGTKLAAGKEIGHHSILTTLEQIVHHSV